MRDWNSPRSGFIEEGKSLRQIAEETGIPYSTLANRAKSENWRAKREELLQEDNSLRLERLIKKLLDQIEAALSSGEGMEAKDFKAVTGALRELGEMHADSGVRTAGGELTVRFVGEAEEFSR